ncbi:MAG: MATE family efflux transporter [Clostridia bacterium]|nr:MATE family efflux transporter [Clostridia bacterium]
MSSSIRSRDMTQGALLPQIVLFSLPLAASGILQLLFNAADVVVVGKFAGSTSLAAVGATGALVSMLVGAFLGISVGVNILAARYIGSRQQEHLHRTVLSLLLGVFVFLIGFFLSGPMLRLMDTPEDIIDLSALYLRIIFIGVPAQLVYNFGAAILRAFGDTRKPLLFLSIAGTVNVLLNLFFVVVCHLGVAGVAIATCASHYTSATLVLRCLAKQEGSARLELKKIRLHKEEAFRIIQIGLPAGLQSVLFSIANVMIQSSVNSFGSNVVAANTAAANIGGFVYTAMNSVYHAALTFTSQNLGAGKPERSPKIFGGCILTVASIGILLSSASWLFGPQLLSIYVSRSDPNYASIIEYGMIRTLYVTVPYGLCGIMEVCCGMVRGLGKSWLPMFVTVLGACAFRIVWIATVFNAFQTLPVLYLSLPASWIVTTLAHVICFLIIYRKALRRKITKPSVI